MVAVTLSCEAHERVYKVRSAFQSNKDFVSMMSPRPSAAAERAESSPVLVAKVGGQDGALLVGRPGRRLSQGTRAAAPGAVTVARLCPRGAFSHVVAYTRQMSALRGTVDTMLDAASYGN